MRMKTNGEGGGGKIVQVEGGHILRSTGRKDRQSKVYTSKGPRDRRVRLAAHTAIQFYDVQDRLGYDRPSKAVDWLINKAKNAIDNLRELPPRNQSDDSSTAYPSLIALAQHLEPSSSPFSPQLGRNWSLIEQASVQSNQRNCGISNKKINITSPVQLTPLSNPGSIPPQYVNAQSVEDTKKLFLPTSWINFQNYPSIQTGDLCLSLQSSQELNPSHTSVTNQGIFSGSAPVTYSASFPRMLDWNGEGRVGFISEFSQSSFSNLGRAWDEQPPPLPAGDCRNLPYADHPPESRRQFFPAGFSGLQVPARFQGEEEIGTGSSVSLNSLN